MARKESGAQAGPMRIYISGKITGREDEARAEFAAAAEEISICGDVPVNPFDNGLGDGDPWEMHLARDIVALMGCDAMLMLPGWEQSRGARLERQIALECGIRIIEPRGAEKGAEHYF